MQQRHITTNSTDKCTLLFVGGNKVKPYKEYVRVLVYPMLPNFRNRTDLVQGYRVSPACPSGNSSVSMKMRVEHWWNGTDRGECSIGGTVLTRESEALVERY